MKMKKTLAFIAALAMLSVTGMTAFAEEAVVTTETEIAADEVAAEAEEVTEEAVDETAEETTEADEVVEKTAEEETEEPTDVEGTIDDTVLTSAVSEDFTIGTERFTTKINGSFLDIYKINDDDTTTYAGKVELDALINYIDHYEVYGNQLVVVCYVDGNKACVSSWYDSSTGQFRYIKDDDDTHYDEHKENFTLNDVSFTAEIFNGEESLYGGNMLLTIYFADGTATNLNNLVVNKEYNAGDIAGGSVVHNVNNYFKVDGDNLIIYYENGKTGAKTSETYIYDDVAHKFIKKGSSSENDKPEVTEEMLYNKFVSEYGSNFNFTEITYTVINGVPTALIKVEDPYKTTVDVYSVTMDNITLINSVPMGGMGSAVSYKSFSCDGYDFTVEFIKTMSDADFISYITIFKCESDGSLSVTNIDGVMVYHSCYDNIGDGTFDWIGNRLNTIDDCFINNDKDITIKYADYRKNVFSTVNYVYDEKTNTFVTGKSDGGSTSGGSSNSGGSAGSSGTVANSPATSDSMSIPAVAASAIVVLGSVIYVSKKRK